MDLVAAMEKAALEGGLFFFFPYSKNSRFGYKNCQLFWIGSGLVCGGCTFVMG